MPTPFWSACAGLALAAVVAMPALADGLKDEIAPTGKLRVAIAISPAGGAFWSTKTEAGYAGVPVDLGKEMAAQIGIPVEYVVYQNSGQITDAAGKGSLGRHLVAERSRARDQDDVRPDLRGRGRHLHRQGGFDRHQFRRRSTSPASRSRPSTPRPRCAAPLRI